MSIYQQLQEFLSPEAGQRRTRAYHGLLENIGNELTQFLSPRGRKQAENLATIATLPLNDMRQLGQQFNQGDYLGTAVGVGTYVLPAGLVAKYGKGTVQEAGELIAESLMMFGGSMADVTEQAFEKVIQRLNQPGPMPTVGSNLANIGHNQGPALEPRPRYIGEYSASLKAAEELPQEKGTFDQMRKMLIDRGAKEDELTWSGFDSEFRDEKKVTKQGILQYLRENAGDEMIQRYTNQVEGILDDASFKTEDELVEMFVEQRLDDETQYYLDDVRPEWLNDNASSYELYKVEDLSNDSVNYLIEAYQNGDIDFNPNKIPDDKYVYFDKGNSMRDDDIRLLNEDEALDFVMDEDSARQYAEESLEENARQMDVVELRESLGLQGSGDVEESGVEFASYFTPGSKNYAENRYVYEPANAKEFRHYSQEFGGAHHGESDIMVHTRTGEFPLLSGGAVHHVGEIQSDWAQQLRQDRKDSEYRMSLSNSANEEPFRSLSFDEVKALTEGANASAVIEQMGYKAREKLKLAESFDDVNTPHIGIKADIYEYHEGKKPIVTADPRDSVLAGREFNLRKVLEYFMDPKVDNKFAKEFREELYNKNEVNRFASQLTPDMDGKTRKEVYDAAFEIRKKAREISNKNLKEGGPLIESTNKWVDFALRRELTEAIATGNEYMTINNSEMVRDMTMGQAHGQSEFYDKIVPQRLQKLLRTFDKKAKLEPVKIQTGDGVKTVLGIKLTDELVRKIADKGMPIFSVPLGAGILGAMSQEQNNQQAY